MAKLHQPPKDFSADEREVWSAAQRQLRAQGTWTGKSDVPLLESYCRNVVLARTTRIEAREHAWQITGDHTGRLLKVAGDAEAAAHKFATSLLLTPEARKRHGVQAPTGGAEDELAGLLA